MDVFLDLAGPDSAAAWATISQVVWDYGFRTEFVFHVLPSPQNQVSFDAAKVSLLSCTYVFRTTKKVVTFQAYNYFLYYVETEYLV